MVSNVTIDMKCIQELVQEAKNIGGDAKNMATFYLPNDT